MTTILTLLVHAWIPIRVVKYHCIRSGEIDTETARARGENEDWNLVVAIKSFSHDLSLFDFGCSVEAQVPVPVKIEEYLQNIENSRHLSENESPMSTVNQVSHQPVQSL